MFDHKNKVYTGTGYIEKMPTLIRKALHIYYGQKKRSGTKYSLRQFIYWYVTNPKLKTLKNPQVARFDHSKAYSWDNIELQERLENTLERNFRCGNPGRTHRAVSAINLKTGKKLMDFSTKVEAAKFYGVSEKTVYNHCNNKTKRPFKFGPGAKNSVNLRFVWR